MSGQRFSKVIFFVPIGIKDTGLVQGFKRWKRGFSEGKLPFQCDFVHPIIYSVSPAIR
jgi:hypothetical protein